MKRRRVRIDRLLIVIIILWVIILSLVFAFKNVLFKASDLKAEEVCEYDADIPIEFDIKLNSKRYLMSKNGEENQIVYALGEDEMFYPASLTKLLTLATALDYIDDYALIREVKEEDIAGLYEANASVLGLRAGDKISLNGALYGLILPSAADCANVLRDYVEEVSGKDFIALMNEKAQVIGMNDSHFSNVTGLFDEDNYSTLSDINKLLVYLWKIPKAKEVLTSFYYESDGYLFYATTYRHKDELSSSGAKVIGGKIGFTYESQYNYASIVEESDGTIWFLITGTASTLEDDADALGYIEDVHNILNTYYN